jgi:hypothetical protein
MRYIKLYEDLVDYNKFNDIVGVLESECKEFLDEMGSEILYRGSYLSADGYCLKSVRSNRRPMDMNSTVNGLLSDAFIKKFGVSIRKEGVFSTKNADIADNYGSVCMFFPVGSYKYYYTKMFTDLYGYISNRLWYRNLGIDYASYIRQTEFGEYCYKGENGIYRTFSGNITIAMNRIISCYKSEVKGMDTSTISNKMSLLPRMTLEEYNSYNEFEREKDIDYIVNTYVSDNILDVEDEEIVFVCDKYYLVDSKFYSKMRDYLKERLV